MRQTLSKDELREQNKQKVLNATLECMKECGIQETKLSEVAKKAGVTTRSIQRYYGDRETLLIEAIDCMMKQKHKVIVDAFDAFDTKEKTGIELVEVFLKLQKSHFKEASIEYVIMNEIEIYFYRSGMKSKNFEAYMKHLNYLAYFFRSLILIGINDGTIRTDQSAESMADIFALKFVGILRRLALVFMNDGDMEVSIEIEAYMDLAINLMLKGLKKENNEN